MKRTLIAVVGAIAIIANSQTFAQTAVGPSDTDAALVIPPAEQTIIKQYVVKEHVNPVTTKEQMSVGGTVSADVELSAVPSDWGPSMAKYRYLYTDNKVVVVEPVSRKIVQIVD
jgi:hypothetical protein